MNPVPAVPEGLPVDTTPVAPEVIAPYSSLPQVVDPNDPFPDLAFGDAIPGTFIQGEQVVSCPDFSSVAVDYNVARQELTTYCVKVYKTPQAIVDTTVATDSVFMSPLTDTPLIDPALVDTTSTDTTVKTGGLAGSSVRGDYLTPDMAKSPPPVRAGGFWLWCLLHRLFGKRSFDTFS